MCKSRNVVVKIVKEMKSVFKIVVSEPNKFAGMEIVRNRFKIQIFVHQNDYVKHVVKRFSMSECEPCNSPAVSGLLLRSGDVS